MAEDEERDDGVERGGCDVELRCVGVDEARLRNVMPCELNLDGGDVDAGDAVTSCELARGRNTASTAEFDDVGAVVQPPVQVADPVQDRCVDPACPFGVAQRNRVVATRHDLLRIARDRPPPRLLPHRRRVASAALRRARRAR